MYRLFKNKRKTEALLVYISTVIEDILKRIEENKHIFRLTSKEDSLIILNSLTELLTDIKDAKIVNVPALQKSLSGESTNYSVLTDELVQYYNCIVIEVEKNIKIGENWIPEHLVLSLLAEWVLEEKHIQHYSFLTKLDYLYLLSKFENIDKERFPEYKMKISEMFKISHKIIYALEKKHFVPLVVNKRKKKTKKRKKK